MQASIKSLALAGALAVAAQASAQVTFYEHEGFAGRSFTADRPVGNFERSGFNDRASSVIVRNGWWEMCDDRRFGGQCVTLRPGNYPNLAAMGLNDRVSSVRPVDGPGYGAYGGPPPVAYDNRDYRRRNNERIYEAPVTSVRAVVGPPEQRCWVEQQTTGTSNNAIPGAIAGAVIGGILGHQVGGGRGRDVATGVGAIAGGAVGANVGSQYGGQAVTQDVQRCAYTQSNPRPDYYDVTYNFRGYEHRVQLTTPPGPSILVNGDGEPRV